MKVIHHYQTNVGEDTTHALPVGSVIRHFGIRAGVPTMWVEKPTPTVETLLEKVTICVFGTGWDIPENYQYIQTTIHDGLVWHLYKKV